MGTKVHCKSYLPRHYPMRDLNEEASSNWSPFYDDTAFSRQLFNEIKLGSVSGYSEYDKEMLKQTMLEHEAVFRKQVYELHRLYRIQKDLMDEYKTKQFYRLCRTTETSKSSIFPSQVPPEAGEIVWCASAPSLFSNHCKAANVSDANDNRGMINFLKEASIQYNSSADSGGRMNNNELMEAEVKRSRRIIDLHLPAEAYIDSEDVGGDTEDFKPFFRDFDPYNRASSVQHCSDFELTLGTDKTPGCKQDNHKAGFGPRSGLLFRGFTDLNEPVEGSCGEGLSSSGFLLSNALKIHSDSNLVNQTPRTSNCGFLPNNFLMHRAGEEGTLVTRINADKGEQKREWPSLHDSGRDRSIINSLSSGYFNSEYPMSSESIQLRLKKPEERHLCDKNSNASWIGERTPEPTDISRSPHLFDSRYSTAQANNMPLVVSPLACPSNFSTAAVSGRQPTENISHLPIAVQVVPSFVGSSAMNEQSRSQITTVPDPNLNFDKLLRNGDLFSHMRTARRFSFESSCSMDAKSSLFTEVDNRDLNMNVDDSANENFGSPGPQKCLKGLLCTDFKSAKDLNLNSTVTQKNEYYPIYGTHLTSKQDDSKGVLCCNKPPRNGIANLNLRASQTDSEFTEKHSRLMSSFSKINDDFSLEEQSDNNVFLNHLQKSVKSTVHRNGTHDVQSIGNTFAFPSLKNIPRSSNCSTSILYREQSLANNQKYSQKGKNIHCSSFRIRREINLNAPVEDEEVSLSCLPNNVSSLTCQIDLETGADKLEQNRCSTSEFKSDHLEKPIGLPKEDVKSFNGSLEEAACTIISMSMGSRNNLDSGVINLLPPVSCDPLNWFADVVTSNCEAMDDSSKRRNGVSRASDNDGLDLFEHMTLELKEVEEKDLWDRPYYYQHKEPKDEAKCAASLLFTRPRRGQGRRRRQRKDFQKDVLPTLASLSRQEVTEDLQALGGVTKTSSRTRNNGSTRRNTAKNGLKSPARGRKPRSLVVTFAEVHVDPLPSQTTQNELGINGSIKGWGRTTRRCRRQRMPAIVISAPQA